MGLSDIWYGAGLALGAYAGWSVAYMRLRWVERNLDTHIFCQGQILKREVGPKPPSLVYSRSVREKEAER